MRYLFPLLIGLLVMALHSSLGQPSEPMADGSQPFTPEEKAQLAAKMLAAPPTRMLAARRGAQKAMPQRRKVLSVTVPANTEALPRKQTRRRIARVVVFEYTQGKAAELLVDASSAEVLAEKPIRGRPQASEEEKQDAIKIVRQDPELARLLQANAIFEGGFIVDGPRGAPPKHRFLQVQLLTPDRLHLQRTVTVDLTAGSIANSKPGE